MDVIDEMMRRMVMEEKGGWRMCAWVEVYTRVEVTGLPNWYSILHGAIHNNQPVQLVNTHVCYTTDLMVILKDIS